MDLYSVLFLMGVLAAVSSLILVAIMCYPSDPSDPRKDSPRVIVNIPEGYQIPPMEVDETSLTGQRAVLYWQVYNRTFGYEDSSSSHDAAENAVVAVFGRISNSNSKPL